MRGKNRVKDFPFLYSGKRGRIYSFWSICESWKNSLVYKNHDECRRFVLNPSAMIDSFHLLLGAMLPCSKPLSTSYGNHHPLNTSFHPTSVHNCRATHHMSDPL